MEETLIKRVLPHSIEAEQSVIGSMLMDREAVIAASEIITGSDFYQQQYGIMFDAMVELFNEGKPVDLVTLQDRLKEKEVPPEVSSLDFVRDIITIVPTSANVKSYAAIVSEKAVLRRLIKTTEEIAKGIRAFRPVGGHSSIEETAHFTLIDDCYNANPVSMKAGIDVLSDASGRKVAILGDMFELGTKERKMHYEVGEYAVQKGIDLFICVGSLAKEIANALEKAGKETSVFYFAQKEEAMEMLPSLVKEGDTILVKASHGMHFEKIVAMLKEM